MKLKSQIRPSKPASKIGLVGGIVLLIFGIGFCILINTSLAKEDDAWPFLIFGNLFIVGWLVLVVYMIRYHAKNISDKQGVSLYDIDIDNEGNNKTKQPILDVKERLKHLDTLKDEGIITDKEYQQQRAEIIKSV